MAGGEEDGECTQAKLSEHTRRSRPHKCDPTAAQDPGDGRYFIYRPPLTSARTVRTPASSTTSNAVPRPDVRREALQLRLGDPELCTSPPREGAAPAGPSAALLPGMTMLAPRRLSSPSRLPTAAFSRTPVAPTQSRRLSSCLLESVLARPASCSSPASGKGQNCSRTASATPVPGTTTDTRLLAAPGVYAGSIPSFTPSPRIRRRLAMV